MVDLISSEGETLRLIAQTIDDGRIAFNRFCMHLEAWQIVSYTLSISLFLMWFRRLIKDERSITDRLGSMDIKSLSQKGYMNSIEIEQNASKFKSPAFSVLKCIPWVELQLRDRLEKVRMEIEETVHRNDERKEFYKFLPESGLKPDDIVREAELYAAMSNLSNFDGKISGNVCADYNEEHRNLLRKIFDLTCYTNVSDPELFPGSRKMEAEVVRMVCSLYHGSTGCCGTLTSGGTESIILACLEIIVPVTAHAAFNKAARLLRLRIRRIPVDNNQRADIVAIKRAINNETCLLVASAPCFSSGTIDDIEAISKLGHRFGIPLHVDATSGGFILPFMEQCDFDVRPFDFRVSGVTSISCDLKYSFSPPGISLILYRHVKLLHYQYFCLTDWVGGLYATPTLQGSRSGFGVACTWSTLLYYGRHGYVELTQLLIEATRKIRSGIAEMECFELLGDCDCTTVAFTSSKFNVYALSDRLKDFGWYLTNLQHPQALHICVTLNHTKPGVAEQLIENLATCAEELIADPERSQVSRTAAIFEMASAAPDKSIVEDVLHMYLDCCYAIPHGITHNRTISVEGRKLSMVEKCYSFGLTKADADGKGHRRRSK